MDNSKIVEVSESALLIARDREKERIALELHDSVGQNLHAIRIYIQAIEETDPKSEKFGLLINELGKMADHAIITVKQLTKEFTLDYDQDNNLYDKVRLVIDRYSQINCIAIDVITEGESELVKCQICDKHILRLIQEFLHNSLKYSGADKIIIELRKHKGLLNLKLFDNGSGFDLDQIKQGFGIYSIEARLKQLNALYQFYSLPGIGTKLNATINETHT